MSAFVIRRVAAAETRPLRQRILRAQQRIDELVYPHDDAPETLHVGAFVGDAMVGTATIHPEDAPVQVRTGARARSRLAQAPSPLAHSSDESAPRAWRLRGMATAPEMRRQGCGAALVASCIDHVVKNGGDLVWCNARTSATAFYAALGFATHGDEFELPGIGPHYVMMKRVD